MHKIASAWPLLGQKLLGERLWDSYTLLAAISQVSTYDMSPSNYGRNGSAWWSNMQAMAVIGDKKAISEGKAVPDETVLTGPVATAFLQCGI